MDVLKMQKYDIIFIPPNLNSYFNTLGVEKIALANLFEGREVLVPGLANLGFAHTHIELKAEIGSACQLVEEMVGEIEGHLAYPVVHLDDVGEVELMGTVCATEVETMADHATMEGVLAYTLDTLRGEVEELCPLGKAGLIGIIIGGAAYDLEGIRGATTYADLGALEQAEAGIEGNSVVGLKIG